jgi:carboxypeptidase T
MKPIRIIVLLFLLVSAACITVNAQNKYSKVKIYGDEKRMQSQRDFVFGTLQVDHCHFEDDAYVVEIGDEEVKKLKASPYKYKILIDDLAENFRRTNDVSKFYESDRKAARIGFANSCQPVANIIPTPAAFTPGGMGGYYTYAEMVTKMTLLKATYPAIVDMFSIGTSYNGLTIWCIKISDNVTVDENEPEVMFNALQHCREAISGTSQIFFMQYLAENYATNTKVQQLVNNREIFIIPCVNPDGYFYNETTNPGGGGLWRKNRRPLGLLSGVMQYGVDLNRNYNADWGNCSAPVSGVVASCGNGSATTANDTYWGTGPFSEPETQAIRDFTAARNFRMSIDQHSEGAYNTLPHGRVSLHPTHNLIDSQFLYGFASSVMATYDCHRLGNNLQTLNYEVAGGNKDWMFQGLTSMAVNPRKVYSFTSEAGGGSFWPVAAQIIPLAKGLTFQYLQAALAAGSYADLQDANDITLTSLSGNMSYNLRRTGILDAPITISLIPLQNISSVGSPVVLPAGTLTNYYSTTTGNISYTLPAALGTGQRIRFIWRVTTDGISVDDTITKFYNPVTIFYDDMETGAATANWTVTGGWGYTAAGLGLNGSGKSLAESPVGNYTSGSTRTATYINTIDLSNATAAYLSFWVRHRAENCFDYLRIQISTNGGATYTPLCGKHTIQENDGSLGGLPALTGIREEWTRELLDLGSYIGAGMNNIKLQFQFVSNVDPSNASDPYYKKLDDGFFLDNIRLMKSTSTLITLPVEFISFDGRLLRNGNVELTWNASTDAQHDYFEVERSFDQNNFAALGRVKTAPPCVFADPGAQPGNNYYRIKQVDKDGSVSYSKTINIIYNKGKVNYLMFPNPVTDVLKLRLSVDRPETYSVTVTDMAGKVIVKKKAIVTNTSGDVSIDLAGKAQQVYMLIIRNEQNEILATEKIIKQ